MKLRHRTPRFDPAGPENTYLWFTFWLQDQHLICRARRFAEMLSPDAAVQAPMNAEPKSPPADPSRFFFSPAMGLDG